MIEATLELVPELLTKWPSYLWLIEVLSVACFLKFVQFCHNVS